MRASTAFLALLLTIGSACGRKGPPLPPLREVPETTTDLQIHQEENQVVLRWSYPAMTRSGRPLGDLGSVEIWKAELPPGQEKVLDTPQATELKRQLVMGHGKLLARLSGKDLEQATRGGSLEYRESVEVQPGQVSGWALYAVRSRKTKGGFSDLSNVVAWQPKIPPAPPSAVEAKPSGQGIVLTWKGLEVASFRVERQNPDGSWTILGQVKEGSFFDANARQGQRYLFRVRTVQGDVVGFPSQPQVVDYKDVYPPAVPSNLLCLPEEGRVTLRWDPVGEAEVRYKVFRRLGEGRWVHLADNTTGTTFVDAQPPLGELTYAVKAVDKAGNESEAATCQARGER